MEYRQSPTSIITTHFDIALCEYGVAEKALMNCVWRHTCLYGSFSKENGVSSSARATVGLAR
jgi:hypothetical protein